MKRFVIILPLALLFPACLGSPENVESAEEPLILHADSSDPTCGSVHSLCQYSSSPLIYGRCALGPGGGYVCCNGCIDASGLCQPGTWGTACGGGGNSCFSCPSGESCNGSTCASNCGANEGHSCMSGMLLGTYGNGTNGACVCCLGCFDPDSGLCVGNSMSDPNDCGTGGGKCARCAYPTSTCAVGKCQ